MVKIPCQVSGHGKAPIAQSHQRQLSLKADEIQERLIKNKTLLNVVEPTLENTSLEVDSRCIFLTLMLIVVSKRLMLYNLELILKK